MGAVLIPLTILLLQIGFEGSTSGATNNHIIGVHRDGGAAGPACSSSVMVQIKDRGHRNGVLIPAVAIGQQHGDVAGLSEHHSIQALFGGEGDKAGSGGDVQSVLAGVVVVGDVGGIFREDVPHKLVDGVVAFLLQGAVNLRQHGADLAVLIIVNGEDGGRFAHTLIPSYKSVRYQSIL